MLNRLILSLGLMTFFLFSVNAQSGIYTRSFSYSDRYSDVTETKSESTRTSSCPSSFYNCELQQDCYWENELHKCMSRDDGCGADFYRCETLEGCYWNTALRRCMRG